MRILVMLAVLLGALGLAHSVARDRYPMEEVKVPGRKAAFRVHQSPDHCWGETCYGAAVFLTHAEERAVWRSEAEALEPWLRERARSRGLRGAVLLAVRPGFAQLFPPTKLRYFAFAGRGDRWRIVDEGHASETTGITE